MTQASRSWAVRQTAGGVPRRGAALQLSVATDILSTRGERRRNMAKVLRMNIQARIAKILAAEAAAIATVHVTCHSNRLCRLQENQRARLLPPAWAGPVVWPGSSVRGSTRPGTPASYVHAGEAAHGDFRTVEPDDCIVAFSTSGKTREVLQMLQRGRGLDLEISSASHRIRTPRFARDICDRHAYCRGTLSSRPHSVVEHCGDAGHQRRARARADRVESGSRGLT